MNKIGITGPVSIKGLSEYFDEPGEEIPDFHGAMSVTHLIKGLIKLGYDVSVYALHTDIYDKVFSGEKLKIYIGKTRLRARYRMLDLFKEEAQQITQFILDDKPDIVNAHWSYEFALGTIRSNYPHLITFRDAAFEIFKHNPDIYRAFRFLLDRKVRNSGEHFNVNSYYLQKKLSGFRKDMPIIPNPLNEEYIADLPKKHPKGPIKLLSILTGFSHRKNAKTAILAFQKLKQKLRTDITYTLFGSGFESEGDAFKWAEQNNLLDGLEFKGSINHSELMQEISKYDILFHPSLEESFGNTLIEGMSRGLPVLAGKDSGAVPWVLKHGENGILVDVTSIEAIVDGLTSLIQDVNLYENLSAKGISYAHEFSSTNIAAKYIELYEQILSANNIKTNKRLKSLDPFL